MECAVVRAVFFDAVGTLIYPNPPAVEVYLAVARRLGSSLSLSTISSRFAAAFRRQEEFDHARRLRTDETREHSRWRAIVGEVLDDVSDPERCFQELYTHFATPGAWLCSPGAAEILNSLAGRGYVLGIASNFDHRLRGVAMGLSPLRPVRHLVISSEVGWRKPAPEFFDAVCRSVGMWPEEVLYVGDDQTNDVEGAKAVGMPAVLVAPKQEPWGDVV
jgi:putative hydrolase of the HAD superfamily